ncbi:hypothetical protein ACET3Z_017942 [Daucus carota]
MTSQSNKLWKLVYYYASTVLAFNLLFPQSDAFTKMTAQSHTSKQEMGTDTPWKMEGGVVETYKTAGSRLPDCLHACGSCSPCRLVMIHFRCSSLAEAETCPMAYKCMCNNKSYPVP